jgi:signal transduction histidine kinase
VEVLVARDADTFTLEVRNDGVGATGPAAGSGGMGLRLAAFEALQHGGVVESGSIGEDGWRVRLVVRLEHDE